MLTTVGEFMTKVFKPSWILFALQIQLVTHLSAHASTEMPQSTPSNVSISSSISPTAEPVGTSRQSLPEVAAKPSFGVSYFLIGGQTLINNNSQMSSFDVFDSYISFNYKVNRYLRFSARPAFGYSVQGLDNKGKEVTDKSRVRDLSFLMTFTNLEENVWPSTMEYKFQPRLYLPTSDGSQEQGMIARLRLEQEVSWQFSPDWKLRTYLVPSYFFQRNTTYVKTANTNSKVVTTAMADSEQGIELGYEVNKTFTILPCLHFVDKWSNSSSVNNIDQSHSTVLDYRLGLGVKVNRDFGFTIGLQAEQDLINTDREIEYSYSILTGGSLF